MSSETNWYQEWYSFMWKIYNDEWSEFLRIYVFSKDPPFKIEARSVRILESKE